MNFDDADDPTNSDSSNRSRLPPTPSSSTSSSVKYRECLKNHAVTIGGHAVDGCGEFLPAASDNSIDSLRCAACNCHRNFHRRETSTSEHSSHQLPHFSPYYRTATAPSGYLHYPRAGPPLQQIPPALALPSSSGGPHEESASEERNPDMFGPGSGSGGDGSSMRACGRKRFRTKFTQEQKDRMLDLAERLGWRIQKHDEAAVQEFCNETGIKRHVLKVWMHNNKHSLGKKAPELPRVPDGGGGSGGAVGFQ